MATPFTVDSPTTGQAVWGVDGNGNTIQSGTITSGDGVALAKTAIPSNPSNGSLKVYSPDGKALYTVDSAGKVDIISAGPGQGGTPAWFNVKDYGAQGDGATDDTAPIQAAINAAAASNGSRGAVVYFPYGIYMVTPASPTSAALVMNNGTTGYAGIRLTGDSEQTSVLKRLAAGPIITLSGPSTDTTGATHCTQCVVENLGFSGGNLTGTLVQAYYADDLDFRNVHFVNSADVLFDTAEFWDSRFYNCLWDSSGSTTAGTTAPNLWLRNTAATSGFGYSTGTVNNLYFTGCRWEQYLTGAIRVERGVGTNTGQPYSLYFLSSKMETALVNGQPAVFVDTTARDIHIKNAHMFQGGFQTGYSTAQDVITFGPQFGSLKDILIFNSTAVACIANGATLNAPLSKANVVADNVRGSYTGGATPTGAHINFGTNTGGFVLSNCNTDNGTLFAGNTPSSSTNSVLSGNSGAGLASITNASAVAGNTGADLSLVEATSASQAFGILVTGDTFNRFQANAAGLLKWGSGAATGDANISRTGVGQLTAAANWVTSGTGTTTGVHSFSAGTKTAGGANVITPTFSSGTAAQLSDTTHDYMVYLVIGTAGVITLAIGPTSTPANTIINAAVATSGELISFRLPAAWFVQVTLTTATLATQTAVGC